MAVVPGEATVLVEHEVRELVRRRGIDPLTDPRSFRDLVAAVLSDYDQRALRGDVPPLVDPVGTRRAVQDAVGGLGPLQQYLDDDEVEEIWINSPSEVYVARRGQAELTTTLLTDAQVRDLVERMLRLSGRRLDLSSPFVDAALPGGERLHVVIPDV
ncbi:MAG: Flp pilus assembly complex ATPase component TadA, partial [Actinotalea sp.]|nr:Flp pilus assembly complex ATPase component TadA [Actinotalea sp.]